MQVLEEARSTHQIALELEASLARLREVETLEEAPDGAEEPPEPPVETP